MIFFISFQSGLRKVGELQLDVSGRTEAETFAQGMAKQLQADSFSVTSLLEQVEGKKVVMRGILPEFDLKPLTI